MTSELEIGPAREDDLSRIPEIEARAARLFGPEDLPADLAAQTLDAEIVEDAHAEGRLLVARRPGAGVVGFALLELEGDEAHLEELDVDPDHGRRGIGRALVEASLEWGREAGAARMTLSTFEDVAWNAPFYARCGFEIVAPEAWSAADRARRAEEAEGGLDVSRRVIMVCSLET